MKKTSENKVKEVLHYAKKGMSVRAVARKTGLHYSTISRICNSKIPERQKNRGGRKALITSETKRRISRLVQSGAMDTEYRFTHIWSIRKISLGQLKLCVTHLGRMDCEVV